MADGPWTKVRYELPEDERLHAMAHRLKKDPDHVMGSLIRLWIWAGKQKGEGRVTSGLSFSWVDAFARQSGFAEAMASVGWIVKTATGFDLPNFSEHNWKQLRSRELARERQRRKRERDRGVTRDVTRDESRDGHANHAPTNTNTINTPPTPPTGGSTEPLFAAPVPPPLLTFPTKGSARTWDMNQGHADRLAAAYPDLDVLAEARKAQLWCEANPAKQKTPRGMYSFLARWMERAQNDGRGGARRPVEASGRPEAAPGPVEPLESLLARTDAELRARKEANDG